MARNFLPRLGTAGTEGRRGEMVLPVHPRLRSEGFSWQEPSLLARNGGDEGRRGRECLPVHPRLRSEGFSWQETLFLG
ncbi:MAG TPA: hypothetical protein VFC58_11910 [Desulfosporosinus sp.]|nr:hypothetical protein [Desulfosporosinus sp.]